MTDNTPEQGGRDEFDILMDREWGPALQELDALLEHTATEADSAVTDDEIDNHMRIFLADFVEKYPSYSHSAYESRVEAICTAKEDTYLSSPDSNRSVLQHQLALLVRIFTFEPEPGELTEDQRLEVDQIQLQQKIQRAGVYWFHLDDDSFWLLKMLDELCATEPPIATLPREVVQGLYITTFGRKPEQDALYVQCIQEFSEEKGEEVDETLRGFFESDDPDKDEQVRASLFAIASLNAVEVFEDAFNMANLPASGIEMRKISAEEHRRLLRMSIASIVCGADMTIEQMLDRSQPYVDSLTAQMFQFIYLQIMGSSKG